VGKVNNQGSLPLAQKEVGEGLNQMQPPLEAALQRKGLVRTPRREGEASLRQRQGNSRVPLDKETVLGQGNRVKRGWPVGHPPSEVVAQPDSRKVALLPLRGALRGAKREDRWEPPVNRLLQVARASPGR